MTIVMVNLLQRSMLMSKYGDHLMNETQVSVTKWVHLLSVFIRIGWIAFLREQKGQKFGAIAQKGIS